MSKEIDNVNELQNILASEDEGEESSVIAPVEEKEEKKEKKEGEEEEENLDAIKDLSEDAVSNFSLNFLPALRKVNQDVYYEVITPELINFTRSMYDAG